MKYLILLLFFFITLSYAQKVEIVREMELENSAGGFIVLTQEECKINAPKLFTYRAYATEGNGTVHEGCWMTPSHKDAEPIEGMRIVPVVNTWWDGEIHTFLQSSFKPRKLTLI
jgi:hypothetical protein